MYVQSYWFHSSLRIEDVQWVSLLLSVEREREGGGREGEREGGEEYKIIK